jgi:pimeloyl-ACP methyl ester carboxylesterase
VLSTVDGQRLTTRLFAGPRSGALLAVLLPGFTGSLAKPYVHRVAEALAVVATVLVVELRGHGGSSGASTLGEAEILDVEAAVRWGRRSGYRRVVTVGFSMGAVAALRHAALLGRVDAVVAVSAPADWVYPRRRWLRWMVQSRTGRRFSGLLLDTRVSDRLSGPPVPTPTEAAGMLPPVPLLVIHGEQDSYFPAGNARVIAAAYQASTDAARGWLWVEPGMGHAEVGMSDTLLHRLARALPFLAEGGPLTALAGGE